MLILLHVVLLRHLCVSVHTCLFHASALSDKTMYISLLVGIMCDTEKYETLGQLGHYLDIISS